MTFWTLGCIVFDDSCYGLCHPASDSKNDFHKTFSGHHGVSFIALSQRSFFQFLLPFPSVILCCISAQTLPAATTCSYFWWWWLTTLFIRYDKLEPELTRWCLCSLHAGIQMSPDEVVGSRDDCRHSVAESTVDVPICHFWQIFSARTALFSCPLA